MPTENEHLWTPRSTRSPGRISEVPCSGWTCSSTLVWLQLSSCLYMLQRYSWGTISATVGGSCSQKQRWFIASLLRLQNLNDYEGSNHSAWVTTNNFIFKPNTAMMCVRYSWQKRECSRAARGLVQNAVPNNAVRMNIAWKELEFCTVALDLETVKH